MVGRGGPYPHMCVGPAACSRLHHPGCTVRVGWMRVKVWAPTRNGDAQRSHANCTPWEDGAAGRAQLWPSATRVWVGGERVWSGWAVQPRALPGPEGALRCW